MNNKPIPKEWLSNSILQKRIILHWCVSSYEPDQLSIDSYHLLIDGNGELHRGAYDLDERAPHTYMFNSAIGISICAMGGWNGSSTPYPPTKAQWDTLVKTVKQLCETYDIPVDRSHVLSHGEVTEVLGVDQEGKWDPDYWPHLGIAPGSGKFGNTFRKAVLENSVNENPEVKVRLKNSSTVLSGFLSDAQTMIPLRKFVEWVNKAGYKIKLEKVDSEHKTFYLSHEGLDILEKSFTNINGTGYASLKEIADWMKLKITVEQWAKDKRIVVVQPREG